MLFMLYSFIFEAVSQFSFQVNSSACQPFNQKLSSSGSMAWVKIPLSPLSYQNCDPDKQVCQIINSAKDEWVVPLLCGRRKANIFC